MFFRNLMSMKHYIDEILPSINYLIDLREQRTYFRWKDNLDNFITNNRNMYQTYKIVEKFRNKHRQIWGQIANNDLDKWNKLLEEIPRFTLEDKSSIDLKIQEKKELDKKILEAIKQTEEENRAIVERIAAKAQNDDQKNAATFLKFVEDMQKIEDRFIKDANNIPALESALRKFQVLVNEFYSFKATLDKKELQRALTNASLTENSLKQYETRMAIKIGEWEKQIQNKKEEIQRKEELKEKRMKQLNEFIEYSKTIDEEISPLYLTKYASDRDIMTLKQRIILYDKIFKLFKKYKDKKKDLVITEKEFYGIEAKYPEIEIFKRIEDDYLVKESIAIDKLKQLEEEAAQVREYSKEEVDRWSFSKVKSFLREKGFLTSDGLIGPKKGVDPDDVRFAYNAHQRFVRKGEK